MNTGLLSAHRAPPARFILSAGFLNRCGNCASELNLSADPRDARVRALRVAELGIAQRLRNP
jgi:hypothetical protein